MPAQLPPPLEQHHLEEQLVSPPPPPTSTSRAAPPSATKPSAHFRTSIHQSMWGRPPDPRTARIPACVCMCCASVIPTVCACPPACCALRPAGPAAGRRAAAGQPIPAGRQHPGGGGAAPGQAAPGQLQATRAADTLPHVACGANSAACCVPYFFSPVVTARRGGGVAAASQELDTRRRLSMCAAPTRGKWLVVWRTLPLASTLAADGLRGMSGHTRSPLPRFPPSLDPRPPPPPLPAPPRPLRCAPC